MVKRPLSKAILEQLERIERTHKEALARKEGRLRQQLARIAQEERPSQKER